MDRKPSPCKRILISDRLYFTSIHRRGTGRMDKQRLVGRTKAKNGRCCSNPCRIYILHCQHRCRTTVTNYLWHWCIRELRIGQPVWGCIVIINLFLFILDLTLSANVNFYFIIGFLFRWRDISEISAGWIWHQNTCNGPQCKLLKFKCVCVAFMHVFCFFFWESCYNMILNINY